MTDSKVIVTYPRFHKTVFFLFLCLTGLLFLLIFLYKKLNKENNGQYTVRRIVYKEGGVRDRVRGAVMLLESHLGVQLWPRRNSEEDVEEMQDVQDEERQVENGHSQESDSDEDEQEEAKGGGNGGSTSSLEAEKEEEEEKGEEKEEGSGNEGASGNKLLINLSQLSGSAIWSEDEGGESRV